MAKRRKHVPQRTCIVCRTTADKRSLTRIVRTTDQRVEIDPTGKQAGRGAYICDDPACWKKAASTNVLEKALRTTLKQTERDAIAAHGAKIVPHNITQS